MRPLRLELEGLTSFRERTVIAFDGLELFAVTGPTGAGKSSLIDAVVFALYGQVPRVGREYKQLISHGAERLSVRLDFQVGREQYRIARAVRLAGGPQVRLERIRDGRPQPVADRVKDIEAEVEAIVGLDYEAFVRSVVLPQGQFDAFLTGKPEERRKILVALLNLRVYEDMHAAVNRRSAEARREAEFIAGQLATDYAGVTADAVAARRAELGQAEGDAGGLERRHAALGVALAAAQSLRDARRELKTIEQDLGSEAARAEAAGRRVAESSRHRRGLEERSRALDARLAALPFDAARHLALAEARPRVEQLAELEPRVARLEAERGERRARLAAGAAALEQAAAAPAALEAALAARRAERDAALARREALRHEHMALEVRRRLRAGEECPVCGQRVDCVAEVALPAQDAADTELAAAEAAVERSARELEQARLAVERCRGDVKGLAAALERLDAELEARRESRARLKQAVAAAGFTPIEMADARALAEGIEAESAALARAKEERERAERERQRLAAESARLEAEQAGAAAQAEAARVRMAELTARRGAAADAVEQGREELARAAARIDGLELSGPDEAAALAAARDAARQAAQAAAVRAARLRAELERLEAALARAAELEARRRELEAAAALSGALAQHLQANQFIAYVQEEALRVLAEDGARHLRTLSQGRYSLECEAQEFCVVDHWNADRRRSVRTLSGGETFLASLALALALAERLAELSAEGRAGESLESLFLDEGFGTLDPETLELVVQALEALHGGQRMVGVVTHIQELAERLPARLQVRRADEGATVEVG